MYERMNEWMNGMNVENLTLNHANIVSQSVTGSRPSVLTWS